MGHTIILKFILNLKISVPQLPPYGLLECSRFHTNTEAEDGRKTLVSILKEIKTSQQPKETRWYWINKLFLPIPQWRREETALLYCKNELEEENEVIYFRELNLASLYC